LARSQRLAMVNLDQTVNFYDANSLDFVSRFHDDPSTRNNDLTLEEMRGGVRNHRPRTVLRNTPVCVTTIPHPTMDVMAIGDTAGAVTIVRLAEKWHACDGLLTTCSHDAPRIDGVTQRHLRALHTDWITDIKWIPELDALVTSSLDHTVKFLDIDKKRVWR
jgi:hypothetical protein